MRLSFHKLSRQSTPLSISFLTKPPARPQSLPCRCRSNLCPRWRGRRAHWQHTSQHPDPRLCRHMRTIHLPTNRAARDPRRSRWGQRWAQRRLSTDARRERSLGRDALHRRKGEQGKRGVEGRVRCYAPSLSDCMGFPDPMD